MGCLFPNLKISQRILTASILAVLAFLCLAGLYLFHYHESMIEDRQEKVSHMVERVYTIVQYYHRKAVNGEMTEDEAKQYAFQTIRKIPVSENEYFWINDMHPTMLFHPFLPEMEGKDCTNWTDMNGYHFFNDMLDTVRKNGSGFITYSWPKPGEPKDKGYQKLSYVKGFPPWNWVVGSGIYIDDVNTAFWRAVYISGSLLLLVCFFTFILVLTITEGFKKP